MEKSNTYLKLCTLKQLDDVYRELDITEESLERDVASLMQWLEQTPHLPNIRSKDNQLLYLQSLHSIKFMLFFKTKLLLLKLSYWIMLFAGKETLANILIGSKNSLQKAKNYIDYYYTRRSLRQDLFAYRDPCCDQIKKALKYM